MTEQYHVKIEKERLVFCAGHFITYDHDVCEPLHGHNYHVAVEVRGPLDENQYVIDFIALRDALQEIVDLLDHRMLLPTEHPTIVVESRDAEVEVKHGGPTMGFSCSRLRAATSGQHHGRIAGPSHWPPTARFPRKAAWQPADRRADRGRRMRRAMGRLPSGRRVTFLYSLRRTIGTTPTQSPTGSASVDARFDVRVS